MQLKEVKTWSDLKDYLLLKMDKADDEKSKANPSFSRADIWDHYMEMCVNGGPNELPIKTAHILIENVKKDF